MRILVGILSGIIGTLLCRIYFNRKQGDAASETNKVINVYDDNRIFCLGIEFGALNTIRRLNEYYVISPSLASEIIADVIAEGEEDDE